MGLGAKVGAWDAAETLVGSRGRRWEVKTLAQMSGSASPPRQSLGQMVSET
jgi:hypothetical protein